MFGSLFGNEEDESTRTRVVTLLSYVRDSPDEDVKLRSLHGLSTCSKNDPLQVGELCFDELCNLLRGINEIPQDITELTLDILLDLLAPPEDIDNDPVQRDNKKRPYYEVNMHRFLEQHLAPDRVEVLVQSLEHEEPTYRFKLIQILTVLVLECGNILRSAIASICDSVIRIVNCLNDPHPEIRNTTIFLLKELTRPNTKSCEYIQKLVVHGGTFDRIFEIAENEGFHAGGNVVVDCLDLLQNLTCKNNQFGMNSFLEFGLRKVPIFFYPVDDSIDNFGVEMMVRIVEVLDCITSEIGGKITTKSAFGSENGAIMKALMLFAANDRFPPQKFQSDPNLCSLRPMCLQVLSRIVDSYEKNQNLLAKMKTKIQFFENNRPQEQTVGVLQYLLNLTLGSGNKELSDAALHVLQKYLRGNRQGQLQACIEFTPSPSSLRGYDEKETLDEEVPFGRVAIDAITIFHRKGRFDDIRKVCRGLQVIKEILHDNSEAKLMALRQALDTDETPLRLHNVIFSALKFSQQQRDQNLQISLLILLIFWFHEFSTAITSVLQMEQFNLLIDIANKGSSDDYVHPRGLACFIVAQCLEFCRDYCPKGVNLDSDRPGGFIFDVIIKKIKFEEFRRNLEGLYNSKDFVQKNSEIYDDRFRNIFESVYGTLQYRILELYNTGQEENKSPKDDQINQLQNQLRKFQQENETIKRKLQNKERGVAEPEETENLKKIIRESNLKNEKLITENESLVQELKECRIQVESFKSDKDEQITEMEVENQNNPVGVESFKALQDEHESLLILLGEIAEEKKNLEEKVRILQNEKLKLQNEKAPETFDENVDLEEKAFGVNLKEKADKIPADSQ